MFPLFQPFLAHAFGQVYNLQVPVWLYIFAGAAAVILSFVVTAVIPPSHPAEAPVRRKWSFQGRSVRRLLVLARFLSVAMLLLVITTGLAGTQAPLQNANITFFWIIFILVVTYTSAVLGNYWDLINPWRALFEGWEALIGRTIKPFRRYESVDGYLPALALYFLLIWYELASGGFAIVPSHLSYLVAIYSLITLTGMAVFGKDTWLKYGEVFTVLFGLAGRLSPLAWVRERVQLTTPLSGLVTRGVRHWTELVFIFLMISSTAIDGFAETRWFHYIYAWLHRIPAVLYLSESWVNTAFLLLAPAVYLALYLATIAVMRRLTPAKLSLPSLAYAFGFSLIPLAVGYSAAHYSTLLLIQGQRIIPLLSDPLGRGWDLFGTADYVINAKLLGAAQVWYLEIGLIVLAHIIAVYVAHRIATGIYSNAKLALQSQYPMLALMVLYTVTSLWIITQPLAQSK